MVQEPWNETNKTFEKNYGSGFRLNGKFTKDLALVAKMNDDLDDRQNGLKRVDLFLS